MRIVVACGGVSPEREVSLNSGKAVADGLKEAGYDVIIEDVTSPRGFFEKWNTFAAAGVFIALHGGWGEDGRFQTCLDAYGIPYTGSGPEACMIGMDKNLAKLLFVQNDVPTPDGFIHTKNGDCRGQGLELIKKYGEIIVKPNGGGSTVGVTMHITSKDALLAGLELAWKEESKALVEVYIPGKEATVPVWEKADGEIIALPAIEIRPKTGFYDYTNKYTHGCTEYICPAPFSNETTKKLQEAAVKAHKCLGCRVYSRTDFRVTDDDKIYALEVNTAPGMTSTSLVPKAAKAAGVSFPDFLDSLVKLSFSIDRSSK